MAALRPTPGPGSESLKRFLIQFAHQHLNFRVQETNSIIDLLGCKAILEESHLDNGSPFMEIRMANEDDAINLMKRSLLSKRLYEIWAEGSDLQEIHKQILKLPESFIEPHTHAASTFRIIVESINRKLSSADKIKRIEFLTSDDSVFRGKIKLGSPDNSFHLLEFYDFKSGPSADPLKIYFGRWIADGQRDRIKQYHLQTRHFIANTSMDACLSMVMANLAQVKKNDLVFDPFVGSGSLLVSSAHFGAYVMGTDIDFLLLHARAKPSRALQTMRSSDESVRSNLKQYGLERLYLDVMVADASRHNMWRKECRFDAIITDPPYGIRESAAKIATVDHSKVKDTDGAPRYPQKDKYQLGDIFKDLLNFAAKFLEIGGRLVYWLPIYRPDYRESNIPQHPCLAMESNCEQPLNLTISRRLITMVKVKEHQEVSEDQGASIAVNHYENESFRQKYFKAVLTTEDTDRMKKGVESL